MTYIPEVLTQTDPNNSTNSVSSSSFNGLSSSTAGFNTLVLTIYSDNNSEAGGIKILFSDDNVTWLTAYSDTYFAPIIYTKNYLLIKKYYKIIYNSETSSNYTITSRLSTDLDSSVNQNSSITIFDNNVENSLDAFGKLRVSYPVTLLDIRFPGQSSGSSSFLKNNLQITDSSSGTYSGTYSNSKLVISASGEGYYISQSRNYCAYQPGKSLLIMASGILYPGDDNYTTRIGYFDNTTPLTSTLVVKNGVYFQHANGIYSVNIKNDSVTSFSQSSWNIDKMNGTGPSGLNLDFSKAQLFVIDMEWLGVGRIRFGFYAYGRIQYCHQVTNINILTQPYTNSINLPLCYSIHNPNNTSSVANIFTQICSTVISEGGYTPLGRPFNISNITTPISVGSSETPLLFLRGGGPNYNHQNIIPTSLSVTSSSTNDFMLYRLRLYLAGNSPVTAGTITWSYVNTEYSVCEYARIFSGGFQTINSIIVDENYFYGRGINSLNSLNDIFSSQVLQVTSNISNISDILVLTCQKINSASASDVYATLSWQELY